jgi:hypothetical protein
MNECAYEILLAWFVWIIQSLLPRIDPLGMWAHHAKRSRRDETTRGFIRLLETRQDKITTDLVVICWGSSPVDIEFTLVCRDICPHICFFHHCGPCFSIWGNGPPVIYSHLIDLSYWALLTSCFRAECLKIV